MYMGYNVTYDENESALKRKSFWFFARFGHPIFPKIVILNKTAFHTQGSNFKP